MTQPAIPVHVYNRTLTANGNDSLALIANLVLPGQRVLDIGMGTGALGKELGQRHGIKADGITISAQEADTARAHYRRIEVIDLDTADLASLFKDERYDLIVCADVLEHLKRPDVLLAQCQKIISSDGALITSIPNVGYCGLITELLLGDFRYRPEGLLDATHIRFFTKKSMLRFFAENNWHPVIVQSVDRSLSSSEFKSDFDLLPPSVASHLLNIPDATTYQYVAVWKYDSDALFTPPTAEVNAPPIPAHFTSELFIDTGNGFSERHKFVRPGQIGVHRQSIVFDVPPSTKPFLALRLDPADRPGYFHLFRIDITCLHDQFHWCWNNSQPAAEILANSNNILCIGNALRTEYAALLATTEDPQVNLILAPEMLKHLHIGGFILAIEMDWPMSADYVLASSFFSQSAIKISQLEAESSNQQLAISSLTSQLDEAHQSVLDSRESVSQARCELQAAFEQLNDTKKHLASVENSTVFRLTRPIVRLKMAIDRRIRSHHRDIPALKPQPRQPALARGPQNPVDVVVPIYRGMADTVRCVQSVLAASNQTPWQLILINDCSTESELTQWLREVTSRSAQVLLLENEANLGFVATVNRGMALHPDRDVVLLNSDTEVAGDWIDRLSAHAYSGMHVGTVTPFSNNATICSYPNFCVPNPLPPGTSTASLDAIFSSSLHRTSLAIPTAVGFCMYIRRDCLQQIGPFDVERFGKGYGEENDFCMRATRGGWIHLHALDTFVRHVGGVSFGAEKSDRELKATETINQLYPGYDALVRRYVLDDAPKRARLTVDVARCVAQGVPVILNIIHNRGGGTYRQMRELVDDAAVHARFLTLAPSAGGVELSIEGGDQTSSPYFSLPDQFELLISTLKEFHVAHVHLHHFLDHADLVRDIPRRLAVPYDFTVHDFYTVCPQISLTDQSDRYCGELGIDQCRKCLIANPAPGRQTIEQWRQSHQSLLADARYVIAPSVDAKKRLQRYFKNLPVTVVPHEASIPTDQPLQRSGTESRDGLRVVVIGALSKVKGADLLEAIAELAHRERLPIEFHLVGYAYRTLRTQPRAALTVHGQYQDGDLDEILQWLKPDLAWFPAQCPETYSYTLSTCIKLGLPVVAPNIGAFPERLDNYPLASVIDWNLPKAALLHHLLDFGHTVASTPMTADSAPLKTGGDPSAPLDAFYSHTYLRGLQSCALDIDAVTALAQRWYLLSQANPTRKKGLKHHVLGLLSRLRAQPTMSRLAQMLSASMQRRVKTWLKS